MQLHALRTVLSKGCTLWRAKLVPPLCAVSLSTVVQNPQCWALRRMLIKGPTLVLWSKLSCARAYQPKGGRASAFRQDTCCEHFWTTILHWTSSSPWIVGCLYSSWKGRCCSICLVPGLALAIAVCRLCLLVSIGFLVVLFALPGFGVWRAEGCAYLAGLFTAVSSVRIHPWWGWKVFRWLRQQS